MNKRTATRFTLCPLARELSVIFGASAVLAMPAQAAPQGGNVVAGQAAIQQNDALTTITQGSQRAAIDWRSFNVGAAETVNFIQPNASSAILNRVVGNDPSAIFGRITANGQVLLINPNGILFGRTAQVDVGALTATTSNLSNADFMSGRLNFNEPGKAGATVENQGSITVAQGGFAALVGRQVANSGVITARLGKVALAGGDAFVLDLYGDKLVNLIVDPAAMSSLTDAQGQPLAARVDHSGQILADGGRVQLSVATVKQLVDNLINLSGVVRATSFSNAQGVISLHGDANTRVTVNGNLDASGERGGRIEVTGRDVDLQSGATLAAMGGQGSIAVGGDWQGRGPLANADTVNVVQGATLDASGGSEGAGGTVVLWSDKNTQFNGRISTAGGRTRGDAGQVEVSSKGQLGFRGDVDVFAANGQQGSLLLDPLNLTIAATSIGDSQIAADQLRYFLTRGANVNLSATQNVTVDAEVNGIVTGGTGTPGGGLTLTAGNNLAVNQNIVLNNGALNLTATNGTLSQANNTVLYTGTGAANLRGGAGVNVGQVLSGGAVDIRSANGTVNVRNAIVAATPNGAAAPVASLNVEGAGAVTLNGALVQGNATVRSVNAGVALAGAVLQSQTGNVQVNAGTTITSAANNVGLVAGGTVSATATQAIDLGAVISTGAATLTSTGGGVTVRQALHAGGLLINANGAVSLAGVNSGTGGVAVSSATSDVGSTAAIESDGDVTMEAAGRVGTATNRLAVDAGAGNITLSGAQGVNAGSLLSNGGAITLVATAGGVDVGQAMSGLAGMVNAAVVDRPSGVMITARDGIVLSGAAVGLQGLSASSSAGTVQANGGSIFSDGAVTLMGQGAVTLADGVAIDTRNDNSHISLASHGSRLTVGTGGLRAEGRSNINLNAASDLRLNGDVKTNAGAVLIASVQGTVTAHVADTPSPTLADAFIDAGTDDAASRIHVSAAGDVVLGEMRAYDEIRISGRDVVLRRGLGGSETGYANFANGYQGDVVPGRDRLRPTVGRLEINASRSVELNGLNLDGNANPEDERAGLSVTAGSMIVSNAQIAVNKGGIVLESLGTGSTDGVYLGHNLYSRGWDSVGGDRIRGTGDDRKLAYGINIKGRVLGLFDNTDEFATLPSGTSVVNVVDGQVRVDREGWVVDINGRRLSPLQRVSFGPTGLLVAYNVDEDGYIISNDSCNGQGASGARSSESEQRDIPKVIISNNTANYRDAGSSDEAVALRSRLVPTTSHDTTPNRIVIDVETIAGLDNPRGAGGRLSIGSLVPSLVALSDTPVSVLPRAGVLASTLGMGVKVLGFEDSSDAEPLVWASLVGLARNGDPFFRLPFGGSIASSVLPSGSVPINGTFEVTAPEGNVYVHRVIQLQASNGTVESVFQSARVVTGSAVYAFRLEDGANRGLARVVSVTLSQDAVLPSAASPGVPAGYPSDTIVASVGPWVGGYEGRGVDSTAELRFLNGPGLAATGRAAHVEIRGSLYPSRGQSASTVVQSGATTNPSFLAVEETPVVQIPSGPGQPVNRSGVVNQSQLPTDYVLSRVTVETSAQGSFSCSSSDCNARGTRVFVYDGLIQSFDGTSITDGIGGVAIPGMGGVAGNNNSNVGFATVGTGFAPATGSVAAVSVGQPTTTVVAGVGVPAGATGQPTAGSEDRSAMVPSAVPAGGETVASNSSEVMFSTRPSAMADLGRGGTVPGSAVNVFKKRYRVATSSNPSVCAPGVVQQTPTEGGAVRDCAGN